MIYLKLNRNHIYIALFLTICVSCSNKTDSDYKNEANIQQLKGNSSIDSPSGDVIDTSFIGVDYLRILKDKDIIKLSYRLSNNPTLHSFNFRHNEFSEIVFPKKAIGIMGKDGFQTQRFFLTSNKILILPLIGINNKIQVYYINLKNGTVDDQDIRTSFELVWINENTQTLYTSNMPEYSDSTVKYKINEYTFGINELKLIRSFNITSINDIQDSSYRQYELISKF